MKNREFNLQNVKCAGCVGKIQGALEKLPAVALAQVNLLDKTLHVEYRNDYCDEEVIAAVEKLGFGISRDKTAEERTNLWLSVMLPLISGGLLMTVGMLPGLMVNLATTSGQSIGFIYAVISLVIIILTGKKIITSGFNGFKTLNFNMHSLILLGVGSAWIYSLVIILICCFSHPTAVQHLYFDSSLMIIGLINLGAYFEERAKNSTTAAIKALTRLVPEESMVIIDGKEELRATNLLRAGDIIKIRPGEQLPADGEIIDGEGYLNEAMLTGEALPVHKQKGDTVISGSINTSGAFLFTVGAVGGNTMLAGIIKLVKDAQLSKPQLAKLADQVARIFVPVIMVIALLSAVIWLLIAPNNPLFHAMTAFMTVLIIACPCSVGLAIPVSLMVGIGRGAGKGILIRDGSVLSRADKITTILLDKTGTITKGVPEVMNIAVISESANALNILKSLENNSEHPLAQAVLNYPAAGGLLSISDFRSLSGRGVSGIIANQEYFAGSQEWVLSQCPDNNSELLVDNGYSQIYLADNEQILLRVDIADTIREDSAAAVASLQQSGYTVAMVTGDNWSTAKKIAATAGISEIYAKCQPGDKAQVIQNLQQKGQVVVFVGDGINDAPSLARADIGIAMGGGSDIAMHSAAITLLNNSLWGVVNGIDLAKKINRNMRENLFGSFVYNTLAVSVAAGILYPFFGVLLNPVIASVVMSLSSLTVITNALRLRKA